MPGKIERYYIVVDISGRNRPVKLHGSDKMPRTDDFYVHEFACTDGTQIVLYDPWVMRMLQALRDDYGVIDIISGTRTIDYNEKVNGADDSDHIYGWGVDFSIRCLLTRGMEYQLEIVKKYTGNQCAIGKYNSWLHLGNREEQANW